MSTLVSWTAASAGPLVNGLYPAGLTFNDFEISPETRDKKYISWYKGDPATIADFGMEPYTYPEKRVLTILDVTGAGLLSFLPEENRAVVAKDKQIVITAELSGTAGIWSTPIESPIKVIEYFKTERLTDLDPNVTITVVLDKSGRWTMTQGLINLVSDDGDVIFDGFVFDVQLPEA